MNYRKIIVFAFKGILLAVTVSISNSSFAGEMPMQRVTGIGGFFFRSEDPKALAKWYLTNLGIDLDPNFWQQEKGPTVLNPFPKETGYWPKDKQWMLNFRVRDLDAMVKQLRENGIQVEVDPEPYPYGRFAKLKDPEGNPLELWEPK